MTEHLVNNVEQAECMAYAEAPHREMARTAFAAASRYEQDGRSALALAAAASQAAFHEYAAQNEQVEVTTDYGHTVDTPDYIETLTDGIAVNRRDLVSFAQNYLGITDEAAANATASRVWGRVCLLGASFHEQGLMTNSLEFMTPHADSASKRGDLNLHSLIKIFNEYDAFMEGHPRIPPNIVLGRVWSTAKVNFIRSFIDFKIAELKLERQNSISVH